MLRRTFLAAFFWPVAAQAHSYKLGQIAIGHAWALPARQGDGQAFVPIVNRGKDRDQLVAARSDVCAAIELRRNNRYDDPALDSIPLEPGEPVPMRPTARHLRLVGLTRPLDEGDSFAVILDFLHAGEISIEIVVANSPND